MLLRICDSTTSDRDSTKARNEEKPSAFSLKVESIRCIWLFTPGAVDPFVVTVLEAEPDRTH